MKVLFFSSDWCANCKPVKNMIKDALLDTVDFDADQDIEEFKKYNVRNIPTIIVLDNSGNPTKQFNHSITKQVIESLKEYVNG